MSRLTIFRDDSFLEEHVLMRAVVALGRHPENDIVLDDRTLSRFHARLERRADRYVVVDLGAQNGVYLNGSRITGECELVPGDRIGMGRYVAIFDQDGAQPSRRRGERGQDDDDGVDPDDISTSASMPRLGEPPTYAQDPDDLDLGLSDEFEGPTGPDGLSDDDFEGPTTAVEKKPSDPTLVLLYNGLEVSRHPIPQKGELIVGRSKATDVVISLLGLSRRHARVLRRGGKVTVEDMGSQNGTWVNNARIEGQRKLSHGDLLNFYEYGLLFLEDPDVEIGYPGTGFEAEGPQGSDELAARETSQQDPPSIQTKPLINKRGGATARAPVPILDSDVDDSAGEQLDALGFGDGSYLGDEFDDHGEFGESSLVGQEAVNEGTDVVDFASDDSDEPSIEYQTQTKPTQPLKKDPEPDLDLDLELSLEERTNTAKVLDGAGAEAAQRGWPTEDELEDALAQASLDMLASLEVYVGKKLYTQMPLSNPVTRIGSDPRCELALPPRSELRPWHLTIVNFGGAAAVYRASPLAKVVVDGEEVDHAVVKDGDAVRVGKVRVVYRCR
jgi:pSer/pThr/pTyr-binding forkhead associated (FHA) protein